MVFLVVAALLTIALIAIYPGELSWIAPRGTRWLYDRAAPHYDAKFARHDYAAYAAQIDAACRRTADRTAQPRVLDLGCGTGRATREVASVLGDRADYVAVDFAPGMLRALRDDPTLATLIAGGQLQLVEADLLSWIESAGAAQQAPFDLVMLMEVGEFLPDLPRALTRLTPLCAADAELLMTRPAGPWGWLFPGRPQRRASLSRALRVAGFRDIAYRRWRSRYELLSCRYPR